MPKTICIVTGSRADYGLLKPIMEAVRAAKGLRLQVVIAGSHLLPPGTGAEVEADFRPFIADVVPMQHEGAARSRQMDVLDTAEGMTGFASAFAHIKPEWVVVLGDRIEAFAAAAAASIGGYAVCHIHGGDRAEGVADESMRHAISKLAHLHCCGTAESAARLVKMGESKAHVVNTGSPAIDGLLELANANGPVGWELVEGQGGALAAVRSGVPDIVLLQHPAGLAARAEHAWSKAAVAACDAVAKRGVLALEPNFDAGREVISAVLRAKVQPPVAARKVGGKVGRSAQRAHNVVPWVLASHLPRGVFVSTLAALAGSGGVLVGNSSAGLIEAAALGVPVVNLGPRQSGRQRAGNVVDVTEASVAAIVRAIEAARRKRIVPTRLYGDGHAGVEVAKLLTQTNGKDATLLRKRNTY